MPAAGLLAVRSAITADVPVAPPVMPLGFAGAELGRAERAGPPAPAARAMARSLAPVVARAAEATNAGFDAVDDGPAPRVANTFNVSIAVGDGLAGIDREALQDALVDLLRDAARRQGLDV
jgi:hypothetical protein